MDEQDRRPVRLAPLTNVQPQAATAPDRVGLPRTRQPFRHALRHCCHRSPPRGRRLDRSSPARSRSTSGGGPYLCREGAVSSGCAMLDAALPDGGLGAILAEMEVRASDVFVGRARELEALGRVLDAMQLGSGATVLIAGEAGIGKTRLVSELAGRARDAGCEILVGRSIDLVGTELPFQPFVEALRPLGQPLRADRSTPGSQLRVFEETLARVTDRAATAPVLLVLEDLHWADTSSLDLLVFLAHNVGDQQVLLLATYRADEPSSAERMRRLAEGVRRSGSALLLELGPLESEELTTLLAARSRVSPTGGAHRHDRRPLGGQPLLRRRAPRGCERPARRASAWSARPPAAARGSARRSDAEPVASGIGRRTRRRVRAPLRCRGTVARRTCANRCTRRWSTASSSPISRRTASVSATRSSRKPSTRRSCPVSARNCTRASPTSSRVAERQGRRSWHPTGRRRVARSRALAASVEAARQAHGGLRPCRGSLPPRAGARALARRAGRGRARRTRPRRALLVGKRAGQPNGRGAARASSSAGARSSSSATADPHRSALLHVQLGEYLYETGSNEAGLAAVERAVELVPAEPPSPERAYSLGSLAGVLMVAWRHAESLPIAEQALALARRVGAPEAEVRALTVLGVDLAHLGRAEEGLAQIRPTLQLAEEVGDRVGLERAYGNFTDVLTRLGRPRESARLGREGLEAIRRYGITSTLLICNQVEALLAVGAWDEADRLSAAALRGITSSFRSSLLTVRAEVEIGRGDFDAARTHLEAARRRPVRIPRARPLRLLPRRPRAVGASLDGRGGGHRRRAGSRAPARGGPDPRPALRDRTARAGGAGGARTRPPRRATLSAAGSIAHAS